jgi:asparagine synthase (glutamine-hydrolysing)
MCGVVGAVGAIDEALRAAVGRASDALAHRGPDASGIWSHPSAVLGHRRLAIIDLSDAGRQPMEDPDTGNVLCYNGEIYNYRELRHELQQKGFRFRTRTDTEVLLKAYGAWGTEALPRLRGMFAFALWDDSRRELHLVRDRLGIKPLYVAEVRGDGGDRVVLFASELRALLATGKIDRTLCPDGLASYVWNGFVVGPNTILSGVRALPAGRILTLAADGRRLRDESYWRLPPPREESTDLSAVRDALEESVRLRLVSDVPLGVFLSGGIDSSAVAALAARMSTASIRTFNVRFDEAEYDESCFAGAVARALGTEHHEIRLSQQRFARQLEDALASIDQPTFDGINTYFVSRAVREAGITVALSGLGGDELFGGYQSFVDLPRASRWARRARALPEPWLRALGRAAARLRLGAFGAVPPQTRWGKLGDALASRGRLVDLYQVSYGLFTQDLALRLHPGATDAAVEKGLPVTRRRQLEEAVERLPELSAIASLELSLFVGERLLRDTDAASMAVSLEARVPLLDHEVVEKAAHLHETRRFQPLLRKQVLRDVALAGLEPGLFERPKSGFVLPFDTWCRDRLSREVGSVLQDGAVCQAIGLDARAVGRLWQAYRADAPGLYWSRIWALFVLLDWTRRHRVSL